MDITIHIDDDKVPKLEAYRLTQCSVSAGPDGRGIYTYFYNDVPDMFTKQIENMVAALNA